MNSTHVSTEDCWGQQRKHLISTRLKKKKIVLRHDGDFRCWWAMGKPVKQLNIDEWEYLREHLAHQEWRNLKNHKQKSQTQGSLPTCFYLEKMEPTLFDFRVLRKFVRLFTIPCQWAISACWPAVLATERDAPFTKLALDVLGACLKVKT